LALPSTLRDLVILKAVLIVEEEGKEEGEEEDDEDDDDEDDWFVQHDPYLMSV